ncbi:MAG: hypothetical protein RLZZ408_1403 [Verrucomicrobiota bacterium]|jgi:hypothetical protein
MNYEMPEGINLVSFFHLAKRRRYTPALYAG